MGPSSERLQVSARIARRTQDCELRSEACTCSGSVWSRDWLISEIPGGLRIRESRRLPARQQDKKWAARAFVEQDSDICTLSAGFLCASRKERRGGVLEDRQDNRRSTERRTRRRVRLRDKRPARIGRPLLPYAVGAVARGRVGVRSQLLQAPATLPPVRISRHARRSNAQNAFHYKTTLAMAESSLFTVDLSHSSRSIYSSSRWPPSTPSPLPRTTSPRRLTLLPSNAAIASATNAEQ